LHDQLISIAAPLSQRQVHLPTGIAFDVGAMDVFDDTNDELVLTLQDSRAANCVFVGP